MSKAHGLDLYRSMKGGFSTVRAPVLNNGAYSSLYRTSYETLEPSGSEPSLPKKAILGPNSPSFPNGPSWVILAPLP